MSCRATRPLRLGRVYFLAGPQGGSSDAKMVWGFLCSTPCGLVVTSPPFPPSQTHRLQPLKCVKNSRVPGTIRRPLQVFERTAVCAVRLRPVSPSHSTPKCVTAALYPTTASTALTWRLGCPVVPLFPFLGGLGSLTNPFKQRRVPFLILGY